MPLAKPSDLLQDNQEKSYRIDKYLGEGVTAEVYQATREDNNQLVALKILRPNLPPEIVQSFRDEAPTIGELVQYSRQRYPDEPLHVPRVFGKSPTNAPLEFMVMEFVTGQALDELIIATQGLVTNGREVDALLIARQVLQVLIVLHEDIRRSYSDFQLKNIWWLPEQSLVKVMDWNHVSTRAKEGDVPSGAVGDLIRFGAYLYQLLTGQGAFQTGESEAELAERASEKWTRVSLGTRMILLKALHSNPQNRYQTAHEFLADVDTMLAMWQQDEDDLYDEASLALRQAKSRTPQSGSDPQTVAEYAQAVFTASRAINLFILRSRDARRIERMREELDRLTANISPIWGVGKNYYELGVYSEALKQWEPEARNLKRLDLWHWVVVAQISRQKSPALKDAYIPIRTLLEEAITHLNHKEWELAKQTLTQIDQQGVSGPEFYAFGYEAEAQELAKQAIYAEKIGQWNQAGQAYVEAAKALRRIQDETYLSLLSAALFTPEQLDEKAAYCQQQEKGHGEESDAINEFRLHVAQNNKPVSYLIKQLLKNPAQLRLLDVVLEEAEKEDCPLELAIQLLSAAAFYGRAPSVIFNRLAQKRTIQQQEIIEQYNKQLADDYAAKAEAQRAYHQRWLDEQTILLQQVLQTNQWEKVYTIVNDIGGDVPQEARTAILTTFKTAREERNWPLILTLGEALLLIHSGEEKAEIQRQLDDARQYQKIDLTTLQFNDQLFKGEFTATFATFSQLEEQIVALHNDGLRKKEEAALTTLKANLEKRQTQVKKEVPVAELITALNEKELQDLSTNINDNLQSINDNVKSLTDELKTVNSANEELKTHNQSLIVLLSGSQSKKSRWRITMNLFLLTILLSLLFVGGYFIKATQIDPLATQVAELPTTIADLQAEQAAQSATQIASMGELSLTIDRIVQTQSAITPAPPITPTPVVVETEVPTATPIPLVSESFQVTVIPASTLDFNVDLNGTVTSPLELENVTGGDIDTVFDWPNFDLTLINGWLFDLSGDTVALTHEGQADTIPLQIQLTANTVSLEPMPVMSSLVLSNTSGVVDTISIDGNSLKRDDFVPGTPYTIAWLMSDNQPLSPSEPITYTPTITATWLTATLLRSRPQWDTTLNINLEVTEQELAVNVHGFVCNRNNTTFMFLAITLDSDPAKIYWLRTTGTKELASNEDITSMLTGVFDGIEECVDS